MAKNRRTQTQIAEDIARGSKVCFTCEELKSLDDYYNKKDSPDGKHTHCKSCDYKATRRAINKNPEHYSKRRRKNLLKQDYGLTPKDYKIMLEDQGGVCKICGSRDSGTSKTSNFSVDHDHTTGKVRGLLCSKCNRGLGYFQDSIKLLSAASDYLKENHECTK